MWLVHENFRKRRRYTNDRVRSRRFPEILFRRWLTLTKPWCCEESFNEENKWSPAWHLRYFTRVLHHHLLTSYKMSRASFRFNFHHRNNLSAILISDSVSITSTFWVISETIKYRHASVYAFWTPNVSRLCLSFLFMSFLSLSSAK
mgnify:CR=1 FL=1